MYQKSHQSGRTLLETLAVAAVMGILTVSGLLSYSFIVTKYREKATAKLISEMGLRYKTNPIKPESDGTVKVKPIFPEAERADMVSIKTPDIETGRVSITREESEKSFAVVVNQITDGSCIENILNGQYDHILWNLNGDGHIDEYDSTKQYFSLGKDLLKNWDKLSDADKKDFPENIKDLTKAQIIDRLCQKKEERRGGIGTSALIWGDECPRTGSSFWYSGRCHNCAQNYDEDIAGNCCSKGSVTVCGYCPGECPNRGKCQNVEGKPNYGICVECLSNTDCEGRSDRKHVCDTERTNTCVECIVDGDCPSGEHCKRNHTCEACDDTIMVGEGGSARQLFRWDITEEICQCNLTGLVVGAECLVVAGQDCCNETHPNSFCGPVNGSDRCTLCLGDSGDNTAHDCGGSTPLCQLSSSGTYKQCQSCPAADTFDAACTIRGGCKCDASKGLACDASTGKCKCANSAESWDPTSKRCILCNANYGVGSFACPTLELPVCNSGNCEACPTTTPEYDTTRHMCVICWNEGTTVHGCPRTGKKRCDTSANGGLGECVCPVGQSWLFDAKDSQQKCCEASSDPTKCKHECAAGGAGKGCTCNDTTGEWVAPSGYTKVDDEHCCRTGLSFLENQCCTPSDTNPTKCACPETAPYSVNGQCLQCRPNTQEGCGASPHPWCKAATDTSKTCVECLENSHCSGRTDGKTICSANNVCSCPTASTNGGSCTLACPCADGKGLVCSATATAAGTCGCPAGQTWNNGRCSCPADKPYIDPNGVCRACLRNNGESGEGQCPNTAPVCDKNHTWTCGNCPSGLTWDASKQECICPSGTFWNATANRCTSCLVNYGSGTGACPTVASPVCNTNSWTCEPCPADKPTWDNVTKTCINNPYTPGTIIYESGNTCCRTGRCGTCCGGNCAAKETVKLYPGLYEVIVIGAGGGGSGDANGHHSTNYGMGGTGGSGGSFKGTLKVTSVENVSVTTGKGGNAVKGGTGGTGGTSSISGLVSCPGGNGAYSGGRHSHSAGCGGSKCNVSGASKFTSIAVNSGGKCGSSTYCKHSDCSTGISGSSPAIKVANNYGGSCGGTVAFHSKKRFTPSGNCGYVKITYKGAL